MTGRYKTHTEEVNPVYERIQEAKNSNQSKGFKIKDFSKFTDTKSELHKEFFSSTSSTKSTLSTLKKATLAFSSISLAIGYIIYLQNREAKKSYFSDRSYSR